jgi:Tetratricopeptide repeat
VSLGAATLLVSFSSWAQPNEARRSAQRARGLVLAGQCDQAIPILDQAIQLNPGSPDLVRDRGTCREQLGQKQAAAADYRAYCSLAPDAADVPAIRQKIGELEGAPGAPATPAPSVSPRAVVVEQPSGRPLSEILPPASEASLAEASRAPSRRADAEERQPVAYTKRNLTDPALTLTPDIGFTASHGPSGLAGSATLGSLFVNLSFSPTDHIALRAIVAPLELSPNVHYGTETLSNPTANIGPGGGVTLWFGGADAQGGLSFDFAVSTITGLNGASFYPALPLLFRAEPIRVDTGIGFVILTGSESGGGLTSTSSTAAQMRIPLQVTGNIVDPIFVGVRTGFQMVVSSGGGAPTIAVPLGFVAGASIPGPSGPIVDIVPFFTLPAFVNGGPTTIEGAYYDVGVDVIGHFYF